MPLMNCIALGMLSLVIDADCRSVKAGAVTSRSKFTSPVPVSGLIATTRDAVSVAPPSPAQSVKFWVVSVGVVSIGVFVKVTSPEPPTPPRNVMLSPDVKLAAIVSPASSDVFRTPSITPAEILSSSAGVALNTLAWLLSTVKLS